MGNKRTKAKFYGDREGMESIKNFFIVGNWDTSQFISGEQDQHGNKHGNMYHLGQTHYLLIFSSPEPKAHGELL